jgi:hypothetical protein
MPKLPAAKKKAAKSKKSAKSSATKAAPDASTLEAARYPVGPMPSNAATVTPADVKQAVATIAAFPKHLDKAVRKLKDKKLDTPYREGGWTIRQLIHHIADSHSTALFRVHLALAEDNPTVPGYPEAEFAKLTDYSDPIDSSLAIIYGTHARWVALLESLTPKEFARTYNHSERGQQDIAHGTVLYAWHSKHHLAHITNLRKQKGW